MVSSARQAITCFLLIFCSALYAHSQTNPAAKGPTATISGKVTVKGKGIAGIVVGLRRIESSGQQINSRYKATTDDQGKYEITNVRPGHYMVIAAAPVYISEDRWRGKTVLITKDETVENIDIVLMRGGVITGKVTDSEDRPLVEEQVSLHPVQANISHHSHLAVRTDDRGIYRFYALPPGKYGVAAGAKAAFVGRIMEKAAYKATYHPSAPDISQATIIEVSEGSEATNVDIVVARASARYSARGRIVDETTGQPVPNVRYGVQYSISENSHSSMTTGAVSNSEGEFKLDRLLPGKYSVFIVPSPDSDARADSVPFEIIDQDVTGLTVKTVTGGSVSGVVVLEGTDDKAVRAKLKYVQLYAYVMEDESRSGVEPPTLQPDGSFRIRALSPGMLAFSLSNNGTFEIARVERDGVPYPKGMPIRRGEHVTGVRVVLNHGSGTVRGAVKVEGDPLPKNAVITVSLKKLGEEQYLFRSSPNSAQVDARGQFFLEGVIPGTYEIDARVYVPGSTPNTAPGLLGITKQQIAVSDGSVINVTLTVSLKPAPIRP